MPHRISEEPRYLLLGNDFPTRATSSAHEAYLSFLLELAQNLLDELRAGRRQLSFEVSQGELLDFTVERNRHVWLQVARGTLSVNGTLLRAGDAVATSRPTQLHLTAAERTDALLFELG